MKYSFLVYIFSFKNCLSFVIPINKRCSKNRVTPCKSLIDQTLLPDVTTALVTNGIGYYALKNTNQTSLSEKGLVHSTFLGVGLMTFLKMSGYIFGVSYFILGSLVTKIKFKQKKIEGIAELNDGMREPKNVWGSAAIAMLCAMNSYIFPEYSDIFKIGYVSSLSAKLTDTFQSEVGKAYGNNTFLITNFTKVSRGTEGAISLEGTFSGFLGGIILILEAYKLNLINDFTSIVICFISSQFATFCESYIGATFQEKYLNNEIVNLINTFIAALLAMILRVFFINNTYN